MLISDNLYKYFNELIIKKVGINMFDLDVVNAFSKGTVIILKSYFNSKVLKGDVRIYRNANHVGGVIVFIGITGDLSGRLMFNMSKSTAFKLASALNSESITIIDDIFVSTIKEFVNMVAGSAINDLYTKHIDLDMTPPKDAAEFIMQLNTLRAAFKNARDQYPYLGNQVTRRTLQTGVANKIVKLCKGYAKLLNADEKKFCATSLNGMRKDTDDDYLQSLLELTANSLRK